MHALASDAIAFHKYFARGLTALELMGCGDRLDRDELVREVMACWNGDEGGDGGFGSAVGHDSHLLYTLSAVQILCTVGRAPDAQLADRIASYVASLQNEDGSFRGDRWGEIDTRFSYCAASCLTLLGREPGAGRYLDRVDVSRAVAFVMSCRNFDGGFGARPGDETHAGQVFTCVGALAILGALETALSDADRDLLAWWLCERQTADGGLNGRPQKLQDVCYTWWVLSSLSMLQRLHWVDRDRLIDFILRCQDPEEGGISDRPDDEPDVFHTFFGVAGLSLLGYQGLEPVNAKFAMPEAVIERVLPD